ncbi:UDP-N-acetylmuramoyl-L-alanyl-D-glutamate--2,6-diaminopimelate ligase [Pseudoalteromonas luteoviolacea]|uniref:UDP-N-acetylmuramoyl-L-alanyl-D-glutamate--2, 6-diaminopimelate ligase n=1 Tax=Pseudoalteromonas luteoviolacea TaxID=43657 RepID=UPI001B37F967|nr:UDP-N-acetylmuramoyl-L-alanyl-D-glutamate--2,6-diaminopimelate ligase [Pseudoalteromonas luteoviolacea]MBQ4812088.1 UDP-N-acetylmuramoyl-L-alanyl-D-glutamate--2,6-diaminopimelate ligase [Pseudoalteromonas luteoviolacea]
MRDLAKVLAKYDVKVAQIEVQELRLDSREVCRGDCFIAISGHQLDGHRFIASAIDNGAVCILVEDDSEIVNSAIDVIKVPNLKSKLADIAADFYQQPSRQLNVIGVTGTNGKSTTTAMIANLATLCGQDSAVIGTLGYGSPKALTPLNNTTPSAVDLQRIFSSLLKQYQLVAMEVSSHGIVQGRTEQVDFDIAVFTNLSRDHLDYHGDMQSYANAKKRLFTECGAKHKVLNIDDDYARQWLTELSPSECVLYGKQPEQGQFERYVFFTNVTYHQNGISFELNTSWGVATISTQLFGLFNLYNLCAALACMLVQGFSLSQLQVAVNKIEPVDGRMQAFKQNGKPTCIVDYAHTPDALALALQALQQHVPGKVTCVFGCGGDRDKGKRPLMAKAAEQFSDKIVITSDNPRSEDPLTIINDIKAGLSNPEYAVVQPDRALAIQLAIEQADADNVILIAGKGHEDYQIIGNKKLNFCDRSLVRAILEGESA